jgi:large subunit ribosomal protein L54
MILRSLSRWTPRPRQPPSRCLHASAVVCAQTPKSSAATPFPPVPRPADNDPNFVHPPSSAKAGTILRGIQILKGQPEVTALPDDYYPDWLWEIFEDPESMNKRAAARREIEEKKKIYLRQRKEDAIDKELVKVPRISLLEPGKTRTVEEKYQVQRERQNAAWLLNREKEELYRPPQFEMPPERTAKYHKKINKEKIKNDNYLRGRGVV